MADHFGSGTTSGQQYALYKRALIDAFLKLDPRSLYRNIVMFTVGDWKRDNNSSLGASTGWTR